MSTNIGILPTIIDLFSINSSCVITKEEKLYLHKLLGNKQLITTLLYRGSIHGWKLLDFHSRCDEKGPTICLFKIKDGDCIGGYTTAQWKSPPGVNSSRDKDAMLFNLSCCRHFPSKGESCWEIVCSSKWGP